MPLQPGNSEATISANIAELVKAGHPQNQAAAIAYETARTDAEPIKASGIIYRANGKVLLLKRTDDGDYADCWALPGGKVEADEDHAAAALRESQEEIGFAPARAELRPFNYSDDGKVKYLTFVHRGDTEFAPTLNGEHSEHTWAAFDSLPAPLHPGVAEVLDKLAAPVVTETDVAKMIRDDALSSPQHFANMWLWALRITGTGTAYRSTLDEFAYRRPENYLTDEFLERCNGLPVIWKHPEKNTLNSKEFADRVVGTILLPYIQGEEVWGIARIYDDDAALMMIENKLSTSPAVVFHNPEVNDTIALNDGTLLLIEGKPALLDHLAICELGVWDKGGDPTGIISEPMENAEMPKKIVDGVEVEVADSAPATDPALLAFFQKIDARLDSQDTAIAAFTKARADEDGGKMGKEIALADESGETEDEKEARMAAEKADAEEEEKKKEAKADAEDMKARMDAMEKVIPKADTDEDYADMAKAQEKADSVYNAFGKRAPGPLINEKPLAYRKRLLSAFKSHSKQFAAIDLTTIADSALLDVVEAGVYADAMNEARNPTVAAGQGLRAIKRDIGGRQVTEYVGDSGECWAPFQSPSRTVVGFNKGL